MNTNTITVVLVLLLICCIYVGIFVPKTVEGFYPILKDKIYSLVEDTTESPLRYIGCGMITLSAPKKEYKDIFLEGKGDDPTMLTPENMYSIKKKVATFSEISTAILPTLQHLQTTYPGQTIGPVAALVSKLKDTQIEIVYLLPNFDKEGVPIIGFNALAKAHRSYYRIVYSTLYTHPSKLCILPKDTQCPGVPIRTLRERPSAFGQTQVYAAAKNQREGGYYYDPYNYWIITNYYTPCASPQTAHFKYYAVYLLNPNDALYQNFSLLQTPNVSFLSEYSGIMYGCDFQVVSPNKTYMLRLEEFTSRTEPPGLVLYKVLEGDPFLECRNNESIEKEVVWKIPLSYGNYIAAMDEEHPKPTHTDFNYAHFKIENDVLYLIDKDVTVWSYQILDVSRSPAIVQLDDNGTLVIYDSKNNMIDNRLTISFMKRVASREKSSRYFIDTEYLAENERKYQEYVRQEALHNQALSEKERKAKQEYYNKEVCPIGFVQGEI